MAAGRCGAYGGVGRGGAGRARAAWGGVGHTSDGRSPGGAGATNGFPPCSSVRSVPAASAHDGRLGFEVMPFEDGVSWAWVRFGTAGPRPLLEEDHGPRTTAAADDLSVDDVDDAERSRSATGTGGRTSHTAPRTAGGRRSMSAPTTA